MNTTTIKKIRTLLFLAFSILQIEAFVSALIKYTPSNVIFYGILVVFSLLSFTTKPHYFCAFMWSLLTAYLLGCFWGIVAVAVYWGLYFLYLKYSSKGSSATENEDAAEDEDTAEDEETSEDKKKKKKTKNSSQPKSALEADLKELKENGCFIQHARIPFLRIPIPGFYYKIDCTQNQKPAFEMHCLWFVFLDRDSKGKIRWLGMVDRILVENIHNMEETTSSQGQSLTGVTDLEISCNKVAENHQDHWRLVPKRIKNLMLYEWRLVEVKKN